MKGTLYGVGIGAGNPQFLTYQAAECIKKCNIIAIPDSGTENFISYNIVVQMIPELSQKQIIKISTPMTKDKMVLKEHHKQGSKMILKYFAI